MAIGRDRPRPIAKACRHCLVHVDTTHIPLIWLRISLGQTLVLSRHASCCGLESIDPSGRVYGPKDFLAPSLLNFISSTQVCGLSLAGNKRRLNLAGNGYGSCKVYLAARSSVPMGFSLKAWAEPSKQLCDKLC